MMLKVKKPFILKVITFPFWVLFLFLGLSVLMIIGSISEFVKDDDAV